MAAASKLQSIGWDHSILLIAFGSLHSHSWCYILGQMLGRLCQMPPVNVQTYMADSLSDNTAAKPRKAAEI